MFHAPFARIGLILARAGRSYLLILISCTAPNRVPARRAGLWRRRLSCIVRWEYKTRARNSE